MAEPCYFHVDMDAFYASVEQLDHPACIGKPVIVGGSSGRGVVAACSYEARVYGVHSAMPIFQAKKLCPMGIYLPPRMNRYLEMSRFIMEILKEFAPVVQQISIDEAFLDMSGTEMLLGTPEVAASSIKEKVRSMTGLTISIGIGSSKFIAKMASAKGKPDGLYRVEKGRERDFLDSCSIGEIWGIGKKSASLLASQGITRVAQLRTFSRKALEQLFGKSAGGYYYLVSRGEDPGIFSGKPKSRSVSNELTLSADVSDPDVLRQLLFDLTHQVFFRTLQDEVIGYTAFIKIKYADFNTVSAQKKLDSPIQSAEQLFSIAQELFTMKWNHHPVRLIGAGVGSVVKRSAPMQNELFENENEKKRDLERTILTMKKSGIHLVKASSLLGKEKLRGKGKL